MWSFCGSCSASPINFLWAILTLGKVPSAQTPTHTPSATIYDKRLSKSIDLYFDCLLCPCLYDERVHLFSWIFQEPSQLSQCVLAWDDFRFRDTRNPFSRFWVPFCVDVCMNTLCIFGSWSIILLVAHIHPHNLLAADEIYFLVTTSVFRCVPLAPTQNA